MNELIVIKKSMIDGSECDSVDARELYDALESKQQFSDWIKSRIKKYGFVQEVDFVHDSELYETRTGFSKRSVYTLTVDMAKQLAMVEGTEKGSMVRKYFIDCEKKLKTVRQRFIEERSTNSQRYTNNDLVPIAPQITSALEIAKAFGLEGNQAILTANKAVKKLTGVDCLDLMELKALPAPEQQLEYNSTDFGRLYAGGIGANVVNCMMELLGMFKSYRDSKGVLKWEITENGKGYALYKDVDKKTGGVPIKQIFIKECAKDLVTSDILVKAAARAKEHRSMASKFKVASATC